MSAICMEYFVYVQTVVGYSYYAVTWYSTKHPFTANVWAYRYMMYITGSCGLWVMQLVWIRNRRGLVHDWLQRILPGITTVCRYLLIYPISVRTPNGSNKQANWQRQTFALPAGNYSSTEWPSRAVGR
ncbi:hypothetical protein F4861DRAFT_350425 [Xylaria intraflava]|nr:hypothetical protein F4861DRAFT_350425 [Xylaria intraflava]